MSRNLLIFIFGICLASAGGELSRTMLPVRDWLVWGETYKAVLAADRAVDDAWRACRTPDALPAADPEAAWRHTRLGITAGLVVLLLVVWIWQKKAGR